MMVTGDGYELHCADCLDVLPTLEAGSVDLTVTSPPYDNLRDYGETFNPDAFNWRGIIEALYRVTKPGGVVVWVVGDATINGSETGTSFRQALWAMECGFNLHDTMIYQQAGTGAKGSNYAYWQAFEYMFVFSKDQIKTSNRIRDKINRQAGNICGQSVLYQKRKTRNERGLRVVHRIGIRENVWKYQVGNNGDDPIATEHPATFPERLAHDHIISWSNPGDVILDPMMGSGTTGKMAIKAGRRFIGIELEREYFDIAHQRIANAAGDFMTTDREREAGQMALWDLGK